MTEPRTNRAGRRQQSGALENGSRNESGAIGQSSPPGTQQSPHEYRRQLTDMELVALGTNVQARMAALLSQGVPLPMAEIDAHHIIGLLDAIAGPEISLRLSEWHLTWLDRQLDQTEAAVRARLIESGVFDAPSVPHSPAP